MVSNRYCLDNFESGVGKGMGSSGTSGLLQYCKKNDAFLASSHQLIQISLLFYAGPQREISARK